MSGVSEVVNAFGGGILDGAAAVIDKIWTTDKERDAAKIEMRKLGLEERKLADAGDARQVAVNLQEAKHKSVFVAGWRPFIGWTCGVALAWHFIGADLVAWGANLAGADFMPPELMGTEQLLTLTLGLLGLGGLRTWEKHKGIARSTMTKH